MIKSNFLKVALAQIAPVWLQKEQTIQKIENAIINAAKEKAELILVRGREQRRVRAEYLKVWCQISYAR